MFDTAPPHTADLESKRNIPGARLCGPMFSTEHGEAQIIRLIGEAVSFLFIIFFVKNIIAH